MSERDLTKDLAVCEAATAGPWVYNGNEIITPNIPNTGIAGAMTDEDCEFIAEAREGWPAAIRRAQRAEAELAAWHESNRASSVIQRQQAVIDELAEALRKADEELVKIYALIERKHYDEDCLKAIEYVGIMIIRGVLSKHGLSE